MSISPCLHVDVRPWEPQDQPRVMEILRQAGYHTYLTVAFRLALHKPAFHILLALGAVLAAVCTQSILSAVLALPLCVGALWVGQLLGTWYYLYGPPLTDMGRMDREYTSPEDNNFWVAEVVDTSSGQREIAGTIAIVRKNSDDGGTNSKVARLRRMAVDSRFRRLGIAEKLVRECLLFCRLRNYQVLELFTTELHEPAQRLYSKLGFTRAEARRHSFLRLFLKSYDFHIHLQKEETMPNGHFS